MLIPVLHEFRLGLHCPPPRASPPVHPHLQSNTPEGGGHLSRLGTTARATLFPARVMFTWTSRRVSLVQAHQWPFFPPVASACSSPQIYSFLDSSSSSPYLGTGEVLTYLLNQQRKAQINNVHSQGALPQEEGAAGIYFWTFASQNQSSYCLYSDIKTSLVGYKILRFQLCPMMGKPSFSNHMLTIGLFPFVPEVQKCCHPELSDQS